LRKNISLDMRGCGFLCCILLPAVAGKLAWEGPPAEGLPKMWLPQAAALQLTRARSRLRAPLRATVVAKADEGGALARGGSQLEQALGALPPREQYNAVLLSLVSKGGAADEKVLELVREMTAKRLQLSPEATASLVNGAVDSQSISEAFAAFEIARDNGACRSFGTPQVRLPQKPSGRRLEVLAPLPEENRNAEVTAAAIVSTAFAGLGVDEVLHTFLPVAAPPLWLLAGGITALGAGDRYLQSGEAARFLGRGFSRLFDKDLQREAALESASFLVGYLLGLPSCPFAPSAAKPLELLAQENPRLDRAVDRTLIWLLAPTALENLQSGDEPGLADPAIAASFLAEARRRQASLDVDLEAGGWTLDEDDARLRWAYAESRQLLKRYSGLRGKLQERMVNGVSAGDCVNLVEEELKGSWI